MKGFILSDNVFDGPQGTELHFWVKSEQGPLKLIFRGEKPVFFVENRSQFPQLENSERKSLKLKAFNGSLVDGIYFRDYKSLMQGRDKLANLGVRTYESDIRPNDRFLMERFINGSVEFAGTIQEIKGVKTIINPQVKKAEYIPEFSIMSLDIETSLGNDLYSIGLHQRGAGQEFKKVYMVGELENSGDVEFFPTEKALLQKFLADFPIYDPDLFVGWHVIGFDLKFLERKCNQYGLTFSLGRDGSKVRIQEKKGAGFFANINGRAIIDGPWALKLAFYSFENFKLDTVAKEVLGGGKDIESTGSEKVEEIQRRFEEDKMGLAKYNLLDCTLVLDIYDKLQLVDHLCKRVLYSGQLLDRLGMSSRSFDHVYLPLVHRKGFVAGNILDIQKDAASLGGYVMEGLKGLHEHVVVLDFKSLYPTIIQTFKIDPYSRLKGDVNSLTTVNGVQFSKTEHILPGIIENLLNQRKIAKSKNDDNLSQAVKILMNSFYGVMGSGGCRFYHADLPQSITQTGQWLLKESIRYIEESGHEVVYGDTDSLFIKLNFLEIGSKDKVANELADKVTVHLAEKIKSQFGVTSYLEMEYEKYFSKLFIPEARGGDKGAKKRYVGLLDVGNATQLYFSGMEFVRSDWTKVAKNFQFQLFEKFFEGEDTEQFIKDYVQRLKDGEFDDLLVYKKRLSKSVDEYTKTNPPHVRAARMILERRPDAFLKDIHYLWTRRGPVPLEFDPTDMDYQHYIDKQIAPLAQDVLKFLDRSFDDIVAGSQMTLF
jgi:DNA polymerase-2